MVIVDPFFYDITILNVFFSKQFSFFFKCNDECERVLLFLLLCAFLPVDGTTCMETADVCQQIG